MNLTHHILDEIRDEIHQTHPNTRLDIYHDITNGTHTNTLVINTYTREPINSRTPPYSQINCWTTTSVITINHTHNTINTYCTDGRQYQRCEHATYDLADPDSITNTIQLINNHIKNNTPPQDQYLTTIQYQSQPTEKTP